MNVIVLEYIDKLGECRGDPYAGLVLNALVALAKRLLHDHGKVMLLLGLRASLRYIKTVTNGAWPLVVIRVTT